MAIDCLLLIENTISSSKVLIIEVKLIVEKTTIFHTMITLAVLSGDRGEKGNPGEPGSSGLKGQPGLDATQEACSGDNV